MNNFNRFVSAAAAVALLAASASCSSPEAITIGKNAQTAVTIDGYEVPAGVFLYNEVYAYRTAAYDLYSKNGAMPTLEDVKKASFEDLDASDWIQDNATDACKDFVANEKEFEKIGGSLTEEQLAQVKSLIDSNSADELFKENGIGEESLRKIIENSFKREAIFRHYYGLDSEKGCTEDELKTYYQDKTTRVKYFAVSFEDENGEQYSADEQRTLNEMVDDYIKAINDEKTADAKLKKIDECEEEYNDYVEERKAKAEAEAAKASGLTTTAVTTTSAAGSTTTTTTAPHANEITVTKYTTTTVNEKESADTTTTISAEQAASEANYKKFNEHIFSMGYDKAEKYQYSENLIYIVIRADIKDRMTEDDLWSQENVDSLLDERYYEDFEKMMKDIVSGYNIKKNNTAYRKFAPFKLKLENALQ